MIKLDVESAINFLKEGFREQQLDDEMIIMRALEYSEVNEFMLKKLENIFENKKTKRVLFVKDQDSN